jgi:hypothetical protein
MTEQTTAPRPATMGTEFAVMEQWACSGCGTAHGFDVYVAAHWHLALVKACDCGTKTTFRNGIVERIA